MATIHRVVDVYDALTTERPYKPSLPPDRAVRELREEAARGWKFGALVEDSGQKNSVRQINEPRVGRALCW